MFENSLLISNEINLNRNDDARFARQIHNSNSSQISSSNNIINTFDLKYFCDYEKSQMNL